MHIGHGRNSYTKYELSKRNKNSPTSVKLNPEIDDLIINSRRFSLQGLDPFSGLFCLINFAGSSNPYMVSEYRLRPLERKVSDSEEAPDSESKEKHY